MAPPDDQEPRQTKQPLLVHSQSDETGRHGEHEEAANREVPTQVSTVTNDQVSVQGVNGRVPPPEPSVAVSCDLREGVTRRHEGEEPECEEPGWRQSNREKCLRALPRRHDQAPSVLSDHPW